MPARTKLVWALWWHCQFGNSDRFRISQPDLRILNRLDCIERPGRRRAGRDGTRRAAGAFALTVVLRLAVLPSASNVALLAERFGAGNGPIARIILLSTMLAFFSFSGAVALLV